MQSVICDLRLATCGLRLAANVNTEKNRANPDLKDEVLMLQIETARLRLLPCTVAAAQAATADRAALEALVDARVPEDWPAADLRDFLPIYAQIVDERAARRGWGIW